MRATILLLMMGCGAGSLSASISQVSPQALDTTQPNELVIAVKYHDDDGDLGGGQAEIQDCRSSDLLTKLTLPHLASPDEEQKGVAIEGVLDLHVVQVTQVSTPAQACHGVTVPPNQAIFCVTLIDQKGVRSNRACTYPITIH